MKDFIRENMSYFRLYRKMFRVKKNIKAEKVAYGRHKNQYFLYYRPRNIVSDKIILWVHGGGWNAGTPKYFDFVGQCIAGAGYRFVSVGYRHSPKHKYPARFEDVCRGYKKAVDFLDGKGVNTSKIIVSGSSAGAHLASILCCGSYSDTYKSKISGFIGLGGPYRFSENDSLSVKMLLNQLFEKDYDRKQGEPYRLMTKTDIPMLLIQSRHDGLINYSCGEDFYNKALQLGNRCELYRVEDRKNTHSWYTAGLFLDTREENLTTEKFFSRIEKM